MSATPLTNGTNDMQPETGALGATPGPAFKIDYAVTWNAYHTGSHEETFIDYSRALARYEEILSSVNNHGIVLHERRFLREWGRDRGIRAAVKVVSEGENIGQTPFVSFGGKMVSADPALRELRVPMPPVTIADSSIVSVADQPSQLQGIGSLKDGDILFLDGRVFTDPNGLVDSLGPGPDVRLIFVYPLNGQTVAEHVATMTKEELDRLIRKERGL